MTYVRCMCISYVSPARWRTSTVTIRKTVHSVHLVYVVSTRSESLLIINPESSFHPQATGFRSPLQKANKKTLRVLPHVMRPETQSI